LFDIKKIDINTFGNGIVPKFNIKDINIERIRNLDKVQASVPKEYITTKDVFAAIERRYNKFKYAYYNKGVSSLDIEKINRCHKKTIYLLGKLRGIYRKLSAANDPRAKTFGRKLIHAEEIVTKYGRYVELLNQKKCVKPIKNVKPYGKKIRK